MRRHASVGKPLPLASTVALGLVLLAALAGCRCSGSVAGSVNDAGFAIGTPGPSAAASASSVAPAASVKGTTRLFRREHDSGRCPPPEARSLTGGKASGSECSKAEDCAALCCQCPGSSVSWLAAACIDGRCADRAGACAEASTPGFCDEVHEKSTSTGHTNYRCRAQANGKKPGEACDEGIECAPACCPCEAERSWSASACINRACAPPSVTCAVAQLEDFCGDPPKKTSRSVRGEQKNEKCPNPAVELTGSAKAGQKCESFADCAPTCCECGNGRTWLAAACVNSRCAKDQIACLESESAGLYCGRPCRGERAPCWRGGECCSGNCGDDHTCRP